MHGNDTVATACSAVLNRPEPAPGSDPGPPSPSETTHTSHLSL